MRNKEGKSARNRSTVQARGRESERERESKKCERGKHAQIYKQISKQNNGLNFVKNIYVYTCENDT